MAYRESALEGFLALPVALSFPSFFFSRSRTFSPCHSRFLERLLTQTPHCLMNPKDPRGMLKALQGRHGTEVSSSLRLRALFQLLLMYSGAQAARLTWSKWNPFNSPHGATTTNPAWKSLSLPSLLRPLKYLCSLYCNISFVSLSLVNCVDAMLNSWRYSFNSQLFPLVRGLLLLVELSSVVPIACALRPAPPTEVPAVIISTVKPQESVAAR